MKEFPPLNADTVQTILQMLLEESTRPMPEPYDNQWNRHRLSYLRQSLKCVDLWVQTEENRAIKDRLEILERYASETKRAMHMPDADEFIRSRHGLQ